MTRLADETGADAPTIAKAYAITRDAFGTLELNRAVDDLGSAVPGQAQLGLYAEVQDFLIDRVVWFVRNLDLNDGLAPIVTRYREGVAEILTALPGALAPAADEAVMGRRADLDRMGLAASAASVLAAFPALALAPDIILVAEASGHAVAEVAATHFAVERAFSLNAFAAAARSAPVADMFDRTALERAVANLSAAHRKLTADITAGAGSGSTAFEAWAKGRGPAVARAHETLTAMAASGMTVSKATVAANLLADLAGRTGS